MGDFDKLTAGPKWYIVHTYTGYENKVKNTIEKLIESRNLSNVIFNVLVPTVTTTTVDAKGKEKLVEEKIYPSYVFIEMIMSDETWHIIRYISGVTGFVGPGSRPCPLTDEEVLAITGAEKTKVDAFNIGDEVDIIDGILTGHSGRISEISEESGEVTVIVSSIGREMPVSMDAKCIKKK
ncbi:MAG: transcription termination/antitermination factor NusG [Clostridia bacterium]|nr:transcription termination/antitermination factor NusG [Clostridia bacterium]